MKKTISLLLSIAVIGMFIISCGGSKYSDLESVTNAYLKAVDGLISDVDKVNNASDAAKALNNYADKMEKLIPELKRISEKYPDFKNMKSNDKNTDPKLAAINDKMKEKMKKLIPTMIKLMKYYNDPEVKKAQQRLNRLGQKK